jgi:heme o synthase
MRLLRAYYFALKPRRTYANVMMALAGFLFACKWQIGWVLLMGTLVGTMLIILSACGVNNCMDHRIDARMPRTKKRATVTGVVSIRNLLALSTLLGVVGFTILARYTNWITFWVGVVAYVDYVVLYGWSKRHTIHSTLVGTVCGAASIVAGYTAVTGRFDRTALLLFLVMVFWQMPHFYSIGIFREKDYRSGGLPIWTVQKGVRSTQVWILVYTALYIVAVVVLGLWGKAGVLFTLVVGLFGFYWFALGLRGFSSVAPLKWSRSMFGFSLLSLLVLATGIMLAPLLP